MWACRRLKTEMRASRYSPMDQPLMFKLGPDGTPGWFLGDMRIPDPPRISQQDLVNYQQSQIDRKLNDAMNSSRTNMGRTVHVPISANFAVLDDNLIDDNVYYYEPTCLAMYLSDLLEKFMLYYLINESKFFAIDLLGAYYDLSEGRNDLYESRICEESRLWHDNGPKEGKSYDVICYMVHVSTSGDSTTNNSSTSSITSPISTAVSTTANQTVTSASAFDGEMTHEKIMAAIAFLQKAQNANAIKDMTIGDKRMLRSVTETISDTAHNIILDETRGKEKTTEGVVSDILDEVVLTVSINDGCEEEAVSKEDTNVVIKPSKRKDSTDTIKEHKEAQ